jgi:hypothetical protein
MGGMLMTFQIDPRPDGTVLISAEDALGHDTQIAVTPTVVSYRLERCSSCGHTIELRDAPDGECELFCFGCHSIRGHLKLSAKVY